METNIFDIETEPYSDDEILKFAKPFNSKDVKIGNLKDPEKIAAKLEAAEKGYKQSLLEKAALNPHTSKICAIGLNKAGSSEVHTICGMDEETILETFW